MLNSGFCSRVIFNEWTNFIATHCLLSGDIFVKGLDEWFSHSSLFSGFLSAVWLSWLTDRTMDSCHPGCIAYRRSFRSHIFLFSHNCNGIMIRKYLSLMSVTNCVVTVLGNYMQNLVIVGQLNGFCSNTLSRLLIFLEQWSLVATLIWR